MAALLLAAPPAGAGGGVMLASNPCVVTVGFYDIHFTAYEPGSQGDQGFCKQLPDTGEVLFVLDYLHDTLKQVPLELRVIRDPTGLGRFVRLEDVEALDLDAHTVFRAPPRIEPSGSYQVSHTFAQPGEYIAVFTAGHPTKDKTYTAIFPFTVGVGGGFYGWLMAAFAVAAAAAVAFLLLRARGRTAEAGA